MPVADQIDYAALADQARQLAPPPSAPPPVDYAALADQARQTAPAGGAMNFAIVNGRRVPIDDATGEPTPPASLWEQANTSPIHHQIEAARQAIVDYVTQPRTGDAQLDELAPALRLGRLSAQVRGLAAGTIEGALNVGESFTTPVGLALTLTGLKATSPIVQRIPALASLINLPAVQTLATTVHGVAGLAFAAHGAGTIADAATAPGLTPWQRAANAGQGAVELATGLVGVHGATAGPAAAWAQQRRTAAGAAADLAFKQAAPPSIGAPYSTDQFRRARPQLDEYHQTVAPIRTIDDAITGADHQLAGLEQGIATEIAKNPHELIRTRPLDAVTAALGNAPRSDALDKGLAKLETLGLDQPLSVDRANAIRIQLNAENDATLANNKYDIAIARKVDPAFAAREAAAASLRTGIQNVIDARAGVGGFTRDIRLTEGALIAVRRALLRQQYQNQAIVGASGVTSGTRRILGRTVEVGATGAGAATGAAVFGVPGAIAGGIVGKEAGQALSAYINQPPITRDALIEKAFSGAGRPGTGLAAPTGPPSAPGGPAGGPTTPAGPGLPPATPQTPRQIAVSTFLALRARGFSRTQAVQIATAYARQLGAGPGFTEGEIIPQGGLQPGPPTPRGLPPLPPRQLGPGPGFITDAQGRTVPLERVNDYQGFGPLIPDNGARVPSMPPGGYRTPRTDPSYVRAVPGTYAERVAAADPATIAADVAASPAVADQRATAARAGIVPGDRGAELPDVAPERVQPPAGGAPGGLAGGEGAAEGVAPAVADFTKFTTDALRYAAEQGTPAYAAGARAEIARRKGAATDRATAREASRAEAAQYEQDDLAALVKEAQANGYTGDPAALHAELEDRLQGLKELHAEFDQSDSHGLTLLRAIAANGGLSVGAADAAGQGGELRWLKEFQDTKPSASRKNLKAPDVAISGQVRGVRGVFKEATAQTRGGREGGQDLGGMLARLKSEPGRFPHIETTNDLSEAIRAAATGVDDSRSAIGDLRAVSHDLIGTATIHPEDSFDPAALEADTRAAAPDFRGLTAEQWAAEAAARQAAGTRWAADAGARRPPPGAPPVSPVSDVPDTTPIVTEARQAAAQAGATRYIDTHQGTVTATKPTGGSFLRVEPDGRVYGSGGALKLDAPAAPVVDVLDTGEQQPRLPGAGAARQVGQAPVSFRAPAQASGGDFSLETPLTDEQRAADAAKAAGPSLFDAPAETPPAKAASPPPGVSPDDIPLELATRAHAGTSMVPEQRAAAERDGYVQHMATVWADLIGRATTPEQQATAAAEFARYRAGYLERTRQSLSQRSGIMSTMITGPSNFPAARMAKKNATYDKGVRAFVEWDQRARKAMVQAVDPTAPVAISSDRPDAPDALQAKIDAALSRQAHMTAANKIVKMRGVSDETKIYNLEGLGLSTAAARALLEPDFANRLGYPDYELTNNRANIRRMQARIADIGTERARPAAAATFDGGTIEENTDANRIQVTFDAKPDEAMRAQLKANGFKWSPSQQVWQRQRGPNARDAIRRIFGVTLEGGGE